MNLLQTLRSTASLRLATIFAVALAVRLVFHLTYSPPLVGDALEYYINSQSLENVVKMFPYDRWYERTPAYMAFLHVSNQSLLLQIIISALTCVLLERLYSNAGWVFAFYLPSIFFCNAYVKETLLVFLFVAAVFLLRNRKTWLLVVLPAIFAGFISYGDVWSYNAQFGVHQDIFQKTWILWRPDWHFTVLIPHASEFLQGLLRTLFIIFYVPVMILFVRKVRAKDFELWLAAGMTVVAILAFGNERFREPVMPFIIGYVTPIGIQMMKNVLTPSSASGTRSDVRMGLCDHCTHAVTVTSARGSRFILCSLSKTDARFPKYPHLPVLQCTGYRHLEA